MQVTVNDSVLSLPDDATLESMLRLRGLDKRPCAVEINKTLVPKRDHASCTLREGDSIEIVTLVGGG
ncbi:MAG: sulfur carrier protein ThiS [Planctomycetota bacterium]